MVERLRHAFVHCEKLQRHVRFLFAKGSLYKVFNSNLLYHGCVPMDADGNFEQVNVYGKTYCGKKLYDVLETYARKGYYSQDREERRKGRDIIWYIWAGPKDVYKRQDYEQGKILADDRKRDEAVAGADGRGG